MKEGRMLGLAGGLSRRTIVWLALAAVAAAVVVLVAVPDPVMAETAQQVGKNTQKTVSGFMKPIFLALLMVMIVMLFARVKFAQAMLVCVVALIPVWMIWSPGSFSDTANDIARGIFGG